MPLYIVYDYVYFQRVKTYVLIDAYGHYLNAKYINIYMQSRYQPFNVKYRQTSGVHKGAELSPIHKKRENESMKLILYNERRFDYYWRK